MGEHVEKLVYKMSKSRKRCKSQCKKCYPIGRETRDRKDFQRIMVSVLNLKNCKIRYEKDRYLMREGKSSQIFKTQVFLEDILEKGEFSIHMTIA